jgi:hypothetical protein
VVDRATDNESPQWALESTAGTAVAADKTVQSMSIDLDVAGENDMFSPNGRKWNHVVVPNMEWTTWSVDGRPTYTELCYLFESICGTATPSTVGTTGKSRVYTIQDAATDANKTLTIEKGSSVRASKLAYGLLHDLTFNFSRRNVAQVTGQGIGQLLSDGITKTASPTDLPLVPIAGKQLDFYIDSTAAGLGTTQLLRAFSFAPSITNKYAAVWAINSSSASFAGHVETKPTGTANFVVEADSTGMAYLSQYRSGTTIFVRLKATGPTYESGHNYSFIFDVCLGIKRITNLGRDADGVAAVTYETEFVYDSTWAKSLQVTIENAVATL